jgi:hypothetical protein
MRNFISWSIGPLWLFIGISTLMGSKGWAGWLAVAAGLAFLVSAYLHYKITKR